jgi:hypothetical protein
MLALPMLPMFVVDDLTDITSSFAYNRGWKFMNTLCLCREALRRGRISMVDLLVITSSDKLFFILKLYFYKTACLNEKVKCTEPSPSVRIPWAMAAFPLGIILDIFFYSKVTRALKFNKIFPIAYK